MRAAALLPLALLAGCAIGFMETGRVIDAAKVADVKVGTSTKQDVLDLFGPPTSMARVHGITRFDAPPPASGAEWLAAHQEDAYTYEYKQERERFFTLLLYTYWGRVSLSDTLLVIFDTEGKVKYLAFAKQTDAEPEPAPESE